MLTDKDPVFGVNNAAEEMVLCGVRDLLLVLEAPMLEIARFNLSAAQAEKELAEIPSASAYRSLAEVFHEALGGLQVFRKVSGEPQALRVVFESEGQIVDPCASLSLQELVAQSRVQAGPHTGARLVGGEVAALRELLRRAIVDFIEPLGVSHLTAGTEWRVEADKFMRAVVPVVFKRGDAIFGVKKGT